MMISKAVRGSDWTRPLICMPAQPCPQNNTHQKSRSKSRDGKSWCFVESLAKDVEPEGSEKVVIVVRRACQRNNEGVRDRLIGDVASV